MSLFHVASLVRCSVESVLLSSFARLEGFTTEEMESTEDSKVHKSRLEDSMMNVDILTSF